MKFIMVHRYTNGKADTEITYVNIDHINTFAACSDGKGTRITMPNGFLLVEEEPNAIMNKIHWEALNNAR